MKTNPLLIVSILFAAVLSVSAADAPPETQSVGARLTAIEHPVTKTLQIKVPEKISAVFWTIQAHLCSIHISFLSVPDGQKQLEHPRTQVWLLKADGSVIPPKEKPSTIGISMVNHTTDSISYVFPPSAKTEACAAVISIDDGFFVERLPPSPK
jgi:hypothetical protein